ncbi:hypothetical protein ABE488_09025 [Luteimonas sp. TWI662]|uniref:hypothetical protein n=1 Tax=Luteimonas sp. TWI662 TaxID=3136789 RepID=UPI003208C35E
MSLKSELLAVMQVVADASPRSPHDVTQAGVQCLDFIAARGKSMLATIEAFDRLHREHYRGRAAALPLGRDAGAYADQ